MSKSTMAVLGVVIVAAVAAAMMMRSPATSETGDLATPAMTATEPDLEAVRAATAKYQDVNVAIAEGYIPDPANVCESADMMGRPAEMGAMGIHYFRPDLLGIAGPPDPRVRGNGTHVDFLTPAVLLYEPQEDGSMQLVGVENLVFEDAWVAAGNSAPPSFQGVAWDHMVDDPATSWDDAHGFAPHYDRHVWIYRDNPNGVFAQFNPNVTCAHHEGGEHAHS